MIHAHVPTARPRLSWKDYVQTKDDYSKVVASGMCWVIFPDWPTPEEFDEYLKEKVGE